MKKKIYFISLFILILSFYGELYSIPAFARKYNMTCKTCHSPFPKLKAYGDEFAGNGFSLPDQEAPKYYQETGDDELSLLRSLPVAIRLEGFLSINNENRNQLDFTSPYVLKLLSGGEITRDISYYFYFFFSERGEVAGIEDAFVMFNNLFGSDLDIYVGQFQISDPLFKREVRLPFDDYQIYKKTVGLSELNLTYDRGIMLTYGLPTGTDITLEILNGSGIGAADQWKNFDKDKYKNILGRVSQDIGDHIRIGGFGYYGNEESDASDIIYYKTKNELLMLGPDLTFSNDNIELNIQYVHRKDKNPYFNYLSSKEIITKGAFCEMIFKPSGDESKWYLAGLFNWIESEINSLNLKSASLHAGYLIKRNIRLIGEYTQNFSKEFGKFTLGLVTAF